MKLFFDARYIRTDYHDGVSRYSAELAKALADITPVTFIISSEEQRKFLPSTANFVKIHAVDSYMEPFTSFVLNKYGPDVVFSPLQTMGSLGRKFKLILTLHDMTYYKHRLPPPTAKGLVRPLWRLFHLSYWPQRLVLNRADLIVTVSETSKHEIKTAGLTKRPVVVISNAADDLAKFLKHPVKLHENPPKNLIFMGTPLPYKDPDTLVRALRYLEGRTLHILSKISPMRRLELQSYKPENGKLVFYHGVTDAEYASLLAKDAIMVSASRAEGFGLPLAEALKLGVPAVVTDIPIFREVGGKGALYARAGDEVDFAKQIAKLDSLEARKKLVKAGKEHVDTFSWQNSAKRLLATCEKLVNK